MSFAVPRTALVTGAARRLGREIALALARAGWDIAVHHGRSVQQADEVVDEITRLGQRAQAFGADLADDAQVRAMFDTAWEAMGPIGLLINNASRFQYDSPAAFEPAELLRHLGPNLAAPLRLAQRLHARLAALPEARGVVINLLDQKLANLNPDFFSYTVTKAGLGAATRMMAMAFAPVLRINGVSPGATLVSWTQTPEEFERASRIALTGRSSTPADIAQAVVFLADAPAITGVDLPVDGGQHLMGLGRDVMFVAGKADTPAGGA
jgi:NAD(P)-dependent dehydrogenase (short-subunit alcohol dehydrogenase family)